MLGMIILESAAGLSGWGCRLCCRPRAGPASPVHSSPMHVLARFVRQGYAVPGHGNRLLADQGGLGSLVRPDATLARYGKPGALSRVVQRE